MAKSLYQLQKEYKNRFETEGLKPFYIALYRAENEVKVKKIDIIKENVRDNLVYVERIIKSMLWCYGGYKFVLYGDDGVIDLLQIIYSGNGKRAFDVEFMQNVYGKPFEVIKAKNIAEIPTECEKSIKADANLGGRRIGFEAGSVERRITAIQNGKVVYDKGVVWHPKLHPDIDYHIDGIKDSVDAALKKLGGAVESIGISTAGIVVDNEVRIASLFRSVPKCDNERVKSIYTDLGDTYGCNIKVANDGDVAALSGAFLLNQGKILGTAIGTSLAGGYVGANIDIHGYINELAFVPIYDSVDTPTDEWSGDSGVGAVFLSQESVLRLANLYGVQVDRVLTPIDKLKQVQKLVEKGDEKAIKIFTTIGEYYANAVLWYSFFYDIDKVTLMGRVISGKCAKYVYDKAQSVLKDEGSSIQIIMPSESPKYMSQSYTAALM